MLRIFLLGMCSFFLATAVSQGQEYVEVTGVDYSVDASSSGSVDVSVQSCASCTSVAVASSQRMVGFRGQRIVRLATAPIRVLRNAQPVRRVVRGTVRVLGALRPVNIRARVMARRGC